MKNVYVIHIIQISMFPAKDCEKLQYIDLNYLNDNKACTRPSQIDKFYRKYKKSN